LRLAIPFLWNKNVNRSTAKAGKVTLRLGRSPAAIQSFPTCLRKEIMGQSRLLSFKESMHLCGLQYNLFGLAGFLLGLSFQGRSPARQPDSQTARQPDSQTARQPDSQTARQPQRRCRTNFGAELQNVSPGISQQEARMTPRTSSSRSSTAGRKMDIILGAWLRERNHLHHGKDPVLHLP
jgi:hypothetical protein